MIEPSFGPLLTDSGTTFRLYAPAAKTVEVMLGSPREMRKRDEWFELDVTDASAGTRYSFRIDGEFEIPDPASHFQPDDVYGKSELIDHASYRWHCTSWRGRPWEDCVFLETHVGTFTRQGTYRAMIEKLDHLADTGITALELMPVAEFLGRRNWGYDGVLLYAPDSVYGRPDDLKALVDAAHQRELMVFLDVVYNHFGPEGNYLHRIAPGFFAKAQTPWGSAIDYAVPQVRAFAIENALHWLHNYRFDGLRLDAVHAITLPGKPHILQDLSKAVGALAHETGRLIHLVLENDDNASRFLAPQVDPPAGQYRAQWNDDYHHAWHVLLTGESTGYYKDYAGPERYIARALSEGFAYQGEPSKHRGDKARGELTHGLPRAAFVNFLQNHDQIGNRPLGERLSVLARPEAYDAALTVLLLQPGLPLLFMGEEWGAIEPFPFFCDFTGDLASAVRDGRKKEFAEYYERHGAEIPDPLAQTTRSSAILDWDARAKPAHARRLKLVRDLLQARRDYIVPLLATMTTAGEAHILDGVLTAHWPAGNKYLAIFANLSDRPVPNAGPSPAAKAMWGDTNAEQLPPWSVIAAVGGA
jgi:malto-oligosyltrehalose trehalohydrolase